MKTKKQQALAAKKAKARKDANKLAKNSRKAKPLSESDLSKRIDRLKQMMVDQKIESGTQADAIDSRFLNNKKTTAQKILDKSVSDNIIASAKEMINKIDDEPFVSTCWDELMRMAGACITNMRAHAVGVVVVRTPEILNLVDQDAFEVLFRGQSMYLKKIRKEFDAIFSTHSDRQGGADQPEDLVSAFEIWEMYTTLMDRMDKILMPTTVIISELVSEVTDQLIQEGKSAIVDEFNIRVMNFINNKKEEPQLTPEQDPSVITDVAVKE